MEWFKVDLQNIKEKLRTMYNNNNTCKVTTMLELFKESLSKSAKQHIPQKRTKVKDSIPSINTEIKKWSSRARQQIPSPVNGCWLLLKRDQLTKYHPSTTCSCWDMDLNQNFNQSHSCGKCRSRWPNSGTDVGYYSRGTNWPNISPLLLVVAEIWTLTKTLT